MLTATALAIVALGMLTRAQTDGGPQGTLLDFHTMTPVSGPYVGSSSPIRGVNGGSMPWVIDHGDGTLRADGQLEVFVSGLVLAHDPLVPAAQQGTNPSATFAVIVSCMTTSDGGAPVMTNVTTPAVNATPTGNAEIRAKVALPTPCLAPVLFVAGSNGAWFATTGFPAPAAADGGTGDGGTSDAGTADGGTTPGTFTLTIRGLAFSPDNLTVAPGATVQVTNNDSPTQHSVTSESTAGAFTPGSVAGISFDTGLFTGTRSFTIPASAAPGTVIHYYCRNHLSMMVNAATARITIGPPGTAPTAPTAPTTPTTPMTPSPGGY